MRSLESRLEKLEQVLVKPEEQFIIHMVVWDMPDDTRGEPIGYLVNGKVYPNDEHIGEAIRRDYPPSKGKTTHFVLWEPTCAEK
jgi:hypothetical protein